MNSPLRIEILLHFHCTSEMFPEATEMVLNEIAEFVEHGVLIPVTKLGTADKYLITAKGNAWVKAICKVPMPVQAWVDAQGKVL